MFPYITLLAFVIPALAAPVARDVIPGEFIVRFNPNTTVTQASRATWVQNTLARGGASISTAALSNARLGWETELFNGFSSELSSQQIKVLTANPEVAWVKPNQIVRITEIVTQTDAPWGLSRLSSNGPVDTQGGQRGENTLNFPFAFDTQAGAGVDVFVIDTGVRASHVDFEDRAQQAVSFVDGEEVDGNGHGTHVAGTIAGIQFGVAKRANVIGVKVMNNQGSGATDDIIAGLNFVFQNVQAQGANPRPAVVNMSIGGGINQALDQAAEALVAAGIHVVVAAGNSNEDANNSSPARSPAVITVGASTINDQMAGFSNFGDAVDVIAPGQGIISAGEQADNQAKILSGTSMACPHVAGLAAYLLGLEGARTPDELKARIVEQLGRADQVQAIKPNTANVLSSNGADPAASERSGTLNQGQLANRK